LEGRSQRNKGISITPASEFDSITGQGVTGVVDGRRVAVGNAHLMETLSIGFDALASQIEALRTEGQTVMLVAIDGTPAGLLGVADPIRPPGAWGEYDEGVR
jgi:Cu+-exporting ATPase